MKRVLVIGCAGAGKSIFAEKLARATGLFLHHLDRLFWGADRRDSAPDARKWTEVQEEITRKPEWIIEGNYGATIGIRLKRADTLIFLDYNPGVCLAGLLSRIILCRLGLERRPDIVQGCNDELSLKLITSALAFRRNHRAGILKGVARHPSVRLITLKNRRQAKQFLSTLSAEQSEMD